MVSSFAFVVVFIALTIGSYVRARSRFVEWLRSQDLGSVLSASSSSRAPSSGTAVAVKGAASNDEAQAAAKVLLLVAHPDDECMFFGPTVLALTSSSPSTEVHVMSLSNGNHDNIGSVREKELIASCRVLGVRPSHVHIVDEPEMQDGPGKKWDIKKASEAIELLVKSEKISAIVTFDKIGITGHSNHIDAAAAVIMAARAVNTNIPVWELISLSKVRNYASIGEVWFSSSLRQAHLLAQSASTIKHVSILNGREQFWKTREAMAAHASQMLWFRHLHITFSSYMWINHLQRVL